MIFNTKILNIFEKIAGNAEIATSTLRRGFGDGGDARELGNGRSVPGPEMRRRSRTSRHGHRRPLPALRLGHQETNPARGFRAQSPSGRPLTRQRSRHQRHHRSVPR